MANPKDKRFLKGFILACAWMTLLAASTSAKLTKERRLLRHFDNVEVRGSVKVFVTQENRLREAMVFAEDSILESVVTEVRGRTLVVEAGNVSRYAPRLPLIRIAFTATEPVEVIVSAKKIQGVTIAGAGSFTGTNLEAETFRVFSAGQGKIHLENLTADEVEVRMESDGDVTLKGGVVETLRADLSGNGSLRAIDLPALRAHLNLNGKGNAEVRAENWLEAKLTAQGNLRYLGRPVNVFVQNDGTGRVERLDPIEPENEEQNAPPKENPKEKILPEQGEKP
ncbi:MAG: hypothetical protein CMI31_05680 [Opitutae bacterium]|nr:hypothetical protein [Opitutae bacterium]